MIAMLSVCAFDQNKTITQSQSVCGVCLALSRLSLILGNKWLGKANSYVTGINSNRVQINRPGRPVVTVNFNQLPPLDNVTQSSLPP